ncbi:hypothetical protein GA0115255_106782 [Streptomyces sp. Ncost-T6T-2b]|nr:hypothetical protein GA0115255_106782 [Streptomyces sp. Ncost-T6T-2b]
MVRTFSTDSEERGVGVAHRHRYVRVDGVQQSFDRRRPPRVALQRLEPGDPDHGDGVAAVPVRGEQLADLQLDQVGQLGVARVGLVEGDDDVVDAHLTGQQDVLGGLRHDPVERGDDEDRPVDAAPLR